MNLIDEHFGCCRQWEVGNARKRDREHGVLGMPYSRWNPTRISEKMLIKKIEHKREA